MAYIGWFTIFGCEPIGGGKGLISFVSKVSRSGLEEIYKSTLFTKVRQLLRDVASSPSAEQRKLYTTVWQSEERNRPCTAHVMIGKYIFGLEEPLPSRSGKAAPASFGYIRHINNSTPSDTTSEILHRIKQSWTSLTDKQCGSPGRGYGRVYQGAER